MEININNFSAAVAVLNNTIDSNNVLTRAISTLKTEKRYVNRKSMKGMNYAEAIDLFVGDAEYMIERGLKMPLSFRKTVEARVVRSMNNAIEARNLYYS